MIVGTKGLSILFDVLPVNIQMLVKKGGTMKNFISILLVTACVLLLNISMPAFATASNEANLSELTESECISFLKERDVKIPGDSEDELLWAAFAKEIIRQVEENPNVTFAFGYTVLLEFANEIKTAVNEYYGLSRSIHVINPQKVSSLLYNTKYGEWDDVFLTYNCYGYAIETYKKENPGEMRELTFNMETSVEDIAEIVSADLASLGYTVLSVSDVKPSIEVDAHTRLICVRKDLDFVAEVRDGNVRFIQDYHFMKLGEDGNWYHKPGDTNTLMFNGTPSNTQPWVYEMSIMGEYYRDEEWTYESDIYYISYITPHVWAYEYNSSAQHTKLCTECGDTTTENCEYEYSYFNYMHHKGVCADCGNTTASSPCEYEYSCNSKGTHQATCTVCNTSIILDCDLVTNYAGSGAHISICSTCDYYFFESCTAVLTYCGDATSGDVHAPACKECGNPMGGTAESCTFEYLYTGTINGNNVHSRICTDCDYVKIADMACVYKNSNNCTLCGQAKDINSGVILKVEDIVE